MYFNQQRQAITGHLRNKDGVIYIVLQYKTPECKKKQTAFCTGLKAKGNKKKAEQLLEEVKQEFVVMGTKEACLMEKQRMKRFIVCRLNGVPFDDTAFKPYKLLRGFRDMENQQDVVGFNKDMLFTEFLYLWMTRIEKMEIETSTYSRYVNKLESRIIPYFNAFLHLKVSEVSALHIQSFYIDLSRGYTQYGKDYKPLKPTSIAGIHAIIKKSLDYAVNIGFLQKNPTQKVVKPKKEKIQYIVYDSKELKQLFDVLKGHPLEYLVKLTAYYGLRRNEMLGLTWDCIDFENKTLSIHQVVTESWLDKKMVLKLEQRAKTNASIRTYPLTAHMEELFKQVKRQKEEYMRMFGKDYDHTNDQFIFTKPNGAVYVPSNLSHAFKNFLKKNGLKEIRFHDLRHSCASLMFEAGVSLKEIQGWLGHANLNITANIYTHLREEQKKESAQKLDQLFPDCTSSDI